MADPTDEYEPDRNRAQKAVSGDSEMTSIAQYALFSAVVAFLGFFGLRAYGPELLQGAEDRFNREQQEKEEDAEREEEGEGYMDGKEEFV